MTNLDFLSEGGNVFKDAKGVATTQRINQTDVKPTVTWLEQLTGLQFLHADPQQDRLLGSTGLKSTSGDLDLAVDANAVTKEQLVGVLTTWAESHGFEPKDWIRKSGNSVHFKTPITGRPLNGFVQTDFMFLPNIAYSKFFLRTDPASSHSGSIRNIMLSSLAKALGYKINSTTGIVSRATDQLLSNDPDQIARLLLNKSATSKDLNSVENILKALANDPKKNAKLTDFRDYMTNAGIQFDESIEENEVGFLARLRDRIVNQGMTVIIEDNPINHYRLYEAADPRIPYIEDFVFKSGLKGVKAAIQILKQTAANTQKHASIKWDGSPAVIFGRNPAGKFVLTDKGGAVAKTDGLATSPDMMAKIMQQRDANSAAQGKKVNRDALTQLYRDIWPYFETAMPKNKQGYYKGDLLYYPSRPYVEDAGNYVFQPNQYGGINYRIPINSPLGKKITGTVVGVVVHSYMEDPYAVEQPVSNPEKKLVPVSGLMVTSAVVDTLQNITLDKTIMSELGAYVRGENAQALQGLLNPAELRSQQIVNLPTLMEQFINGLKGTDYSGATPENFVAWVKTKETPRKYNNIVEYLNSPRSNILGMGVAFTIWNHLHALKREIQKQLDLQQPGQEGWVFATPAGRAKIVSRDTGGFADPARKAAANV